MLEQTLKNTRHGSLPGNGYGGFCIAAIQHPSPGFTIMKIKHCKTCNKELVRKMQKNGILESYYALSRRKYCDQACYGISERLENPTVYGYYDRLHRSGIKKREKCDRCGSAKKLCFHHADEDVSNNSPDNLMTLCRSCHNKIHFELGSHDKRIEALRQNSKECIICGRKTKSLDLCHKHYDRYRKHSNPFNKGWGHIDFNEISDKKKQSELLNQVNKIWQKRGHHD